MLDRLWVFSVSKATAQNRVAVLGASSVVGTCLVQTLAQNRWQVTAFSRHASKQFFCGVVWRPLPLTQSPPSQQAAPQVDGGVTPNWICVAPIWSLPDYFDLFNELGAERIVVLSSTSRFTKKDSSDPQEHAMAVRLAQAEESVQKWAQSRGVEWIILRPTLIYGLGQDKNIAEIARFITRFGFFPLVEGASGLRQPVHVTDVVCACLSALQTSCVANRAFNISGGETLSYRDMVSRVFLALGRRPRLPTVPLWVFRLALTLLHFLPRYRDWSLSMVSRMRVDMVFDHAEAAQELNFKPGKFLLTTNDLPLTLEAKSKPHSPSERTLFRF